MKLKIVIIDLNGKTFFVGKDIVDNYTQSGNIENIIKWYKNPIDCIIVSFDNVDCFYSGNGQLECALDNRRILMKVF